MVDAHEFPVCVLEHVRCMISDLVGKHNLMSRVEGYQIYISHWKRVGKEFRPTFNAVSIAYSDLVVSVYSHRKYCPSCRMTFTDGQVTCDDCGAFGIVSASEPVGRVALRDPDFEETMRSIVDAALSMDMPGSRYDSK